MATTSCANPGFLASASNTLARRNLISAVLTTSSKDWVGRGADSSLRGRFGGRFGVAWCQKAKEVNLTMSGVAWEDIALVNQVGVRACEECGDGVSGRGRKCE
jgi:hypothetical protein